MRAAYRNNNEPLFHGVINFSCSTGRYFQTTGNLHDIESYFGIDNMTALNARLFLCHWGHLSIIFVWVSSNLFHIGWNGNYKLWAKNPIKTNPIAHGIWDPHFGITISDAYLYNELFLVLFIQSSVNRNIVRFIYHKFIL